MKPVREIDPESRGRWIVNTEESEYVLDLKSRFGTRTLHDAARQADNEEWDIRMMIRCRVGDPIHFIVYDDEHNALIASVRSTNSPVVDIRQA